MPLNRDQDIAVGSILEDMYDSDNPRPGSTLIGEGGTGKTFCVVEIARDALAGGNSVLCTAPTNKAVKQLEKAFKAAGLNSPLLGFCTIHRALGLGLMPSDERKFVARTKEAIIENYSLLVIDEASMLNRVMLFNYLLPDLEACEAYPILMGDDMQLPPVRESRSEAFGLFPCYELTINQRQQNNPDGTPNGILQVAHKLRKAIKNNTEFTFSEAPPNNVELVLDRYFLEKIAEEFTADTDLEKVRVLAWTNRRVDHINDLIRKKIYGKGVARYELNERIVTGGPVNDLEGNPLLSTDEECIVAAISESSLTDDRTGEEWKTICLALRPVYADQRQVFAHVLHDSERSRFEDRCEKLSNKAKSASGSDKGRLWFQYWQFVELFADIKYCYCITLHRAQGSTFHTVFLDVKNLLENPKRSERQRLLYVGWSRPQVRLVINKTGFKA